MIEFKYGDIWEDQISGHKIGCLDATNYDDVKKIMGNKKAQLSLQDPPYNIDINEEFKKDDIEKYIKFSNLWVDNVIQFLDDNASFYVWLGADIKNNLQPFIEFVQMMKDKPLKLRNFITMRNQRGYGTQKNWMAVRQELLYYIKGNPIFNVNAEYTEIPKKTKGFYKKVGGKITENIERSKSNYIRAGNVWYDIQQVFFIIEENVEGCFAQKPLKSAKRIIDSATKRGDLVIDFFGHSGTTLLQCEISNRVCYTIDNNPEYCKLIYLRLLNYRKNKKTGFGRKKVLVKNILQITESDL